MTYRSILALADAEQEDAQTLAFAARLARDFDAAVTVIPAASDAVEEMISMGTAMGAPYTPEVALAVEDAHVDQLGKIVAMGKVAAKEFGIGWEAAGHTPSMSVRDSREPCWMGLAKTVGLADLTVVGQSFLDSRAHLQGVLGDLLIDLRAPVLVARGTPDRLIGTVAIAWDGSRQAGRAVREAMPLIERAGRVVVLQCRGGLDVVAGDPTPDALIRYLALHGVAKVEQKIMTDKEAGAALMQAACDLDASIVVCGAYSHARLREALFGGVTQRFLDTVNGPSLFLAH